MVQRRWWAPSLLLVKRVWSELKPKTGSRGKYKSEPATGRGGEGQGALVVQPARKLLQQVICTPTGNTAGQKLSWLLRGGNCTLLRTDSLFAVVGCDCHTHRVPLHTKKTQ